MTALLVLGLVLISAALLMRALDRLDADLCEWANVTGHDDDAPVTR